MSRILDCLIVRLLVIINNERLLTSQFSLNYHTNHNINDNIIKDPKDV